MLVVEGIAFVVQTADGSNITKFGEAGLRGSDPKKPGSGLCQTDCSSQLFAADFDCSGTSHCRFGVAKDGNKKVIVGWSEGGQVLYATVQLTSDGAIFSAAFNGTSEEQEQGQY